MPPRTLATLAHALSVAPDFDAALLALAEALAEVDRSAHIALVRYDARREMLVDRLMPMAAASWRSAWTRRSTTCRRASASRSRTGSTFVDFADRSDEFAPLFALKRYNDVGWLSLRGMRFEGQLSRRDRALRDAEVLRHADRRSGFAPAVALFELAYAAVPRARGTRGGGAHARGRHAARARGVRAQARGARTAAAARRAGRSWRTPTPSGSSPSSARRRHALEEARQAGRSASAVEAQVTAAVEQLEKAHVELHRRSESLRQKTRTLYLIERVLTLDATTDDPRRARRRTARAGRRRHAGAAMLAHAARAGGGHAVSRRRARPRAEHAAGYTHRSSAKASRETWPRRGEPLLVQDVAEAQVAPAAARRVLHDGLVHQLPARLPRGAGRRGEPDQPRHARRLRRGRRRARAPARPGDRARRDAVAARGAPARDR